MKIVLVLITFFLLSFMIKDIPRFAHRDVKNNILYLCEGDSLSYITYNIWKNDTTWDGTNPTIIFLTREKFNKL